MPIEPTSGVPASPRRRRGARRQVTATVAALVAVFALAITAATASAADPGATVTPASDLVTGMEVTVTGTDFAPVTAPPPPAPRDGLYVAQTALIDGSYVIGAGQQWISYGGATAETTLDPDGSFTTTIEVSRRIGSGADEVDCVEVDCVIMTWQAHGNPGGPFNPVFTSTPIEFSNAGLFLAPSAGLSSQGVTNANVGGRKFTPADYPAGIRIAQGQVSGGTYSVGPSILVTETPDPGNADEVQLNANGTFVGKVPLQAKFAGSAGAVDCEYNSCQVIAWPEGEQPTSGAAGNVIAAENISFAFKYTPIAKLSQSRNLPAESTVAIGGSGFPNGQPGLYVAQAVWVNGELFTAAADRSGAASNIKFIRPGSPTPDTLLYPDGTFSTSISVVRTLTLDSGQKVDCLTRNCHVITWPAHTNPTRDNFYTSSRLSFAEEPAAVAVAPRINVVKRKRIRVGRRARTLPLAAVVCGSEVCAVRRSSRVLLRVGKQRFRLRLVGPRKLVDGRRGMVRLRLTGKAARALAGRKARVRFRIVVRSESGNEAARVNRVLVGPRKARRR